MENHKFELKTFDENIRAQIVEIGKSFGIKNTQGCLDIANELIENVKEDREFLTPSMVRYKNKTNPLLYHEVFDNVIKQDGRDVLPSNNGAIFRKTQSPAVKFIENNMSKRKVEKKLMYEAKVAGNKEQTGVHNTLQLVYKEQSKRIGQS